jgi:transcriptional regulator with XRE-family HTH domain
MEFSIPEMPAEAKVDEFAAALGGSVGVDLETWRREQKLTYEQLADRLQCSLSNARRYALGEAMPDGEALHRVLDLSAGQVGLYALYRRRVRWLRETGHWSAARAVVTVQELSKAS